MLKSRTFSNRKTQIFFRSNFKIFDLFNLVNLEAATGAKASLTTEEEIGLTDGAVLQHLRLSHSRQI